MSSQSRGGLSQKRATRQFKIHDDPAVVEGYDSVPIIEVDELPRGGISLETKAVGRIQFGIPPETIKDSMLMGIEVPSIYIVPVERFCREMGPALGINMAEFEFPAYFNYFIRQKRCTLVVDSLDAEQDIRAVFEETLLGPPNFRNKERPCGNVDEDFDPSFPKDARPNFYKEFYNFRTAEKSTNYEELRVSTLLDFVHFSPPRRDTDGETEKLGVPPIPVTIEIESKHKGESSADLHASRRRLHPLLNNRDEIFVPTSPKEDRSRHRRFSNSSDSQSTHSHSATQSSGRRGSTGSTGSMDSGRKAEGRRSSMPLLGDGSPKRAFSGGERALGAPRRDSLLSINSAFTSSSRNARTSSLGPKVSVQEYDFLTDYGQDRAENKWMYSQAKWLGEVATVYPNTATAREKETNKTARVEIFKMAGGTEYIIHDVNKEGVIIGKVRVSGTVRVPDEISVEGFIFHGVSEDSNTNDLDYPGELPIPRPNFAAPTFHPPSFGVTVLGNSHGFDKNGSTSGYVLWVNGRGIMVDPPPYSSATLEREGIRPQMIMAIIITHCHADHDAGTFQKVMTGSRVAIITTPTIYKSFIRKYSALSGLRPSLLRHSHRHRPAIVGQPLRFQGATFHFSYTLHTIPCISFKVEWRGKSIVFTGDHMNIPSSIDSLEQKGVLSKSRADDLRRLPLQECDILLHEAGAPPIHTPLEVLEALPPNVKERLYVVHTAAIPPLSDLRVAPTGTAGTIRLDGSAEGLHRIMRTYTGVQPTTTSSQIAEESLQDGKNQNITVIGDLDSSTTRGLIDSFGTVNGKPKVAPLVFLRPTDVSDSWFMLSLLSAVPFLSTLSYAHTMEILEIAHVEVHKQGDIVISGDRRPEVLCVFWEGTCISQPPHGDTGEDTEGHSNVWHAGDWTGPVSLQPDITKSAHVTSGEKPWDIVALSEEGVKVIVLMMKDMLRILVSGSKLFRKYAALVEDQEEQLLRQTSQRMFHTLQQSMEASTHELLEVIECNSVLRNMTAMQKRLLESLAEGPRFFSAGEFMWQVGDPVDFAYLIVRGSATIGKKSMAHRGERRRIQSRRGSTGTISMMASIQEHNTRPVERQYGSVVASGVESDKLLKNVHPNSEYARLEVELKVRSEVAEDTEDTGDFLREYDNQRAASSTSAQAHRDKFANKVLARLYSRRAYSEHLIFSRGQFLSDTSRMVSGNLANINRATGVETRSRSSFTSNSHDHHSHTCNLMAGAQGCVVMVFPRSTLVPFLDNNPGLLLCLLGTQVVV